MATALSFERPSPPPITQAQRSAAKVVGFLYLLTMATAMFGEMFVRGRLVVRGDALQTARNLVASETLFRSAIVVDLLTVAGVVPRLGEAVGLTYMAPMFFYEVGLGVWLLAKGLRAPGAA